MADLGIEEPGLNRVILRLRAAQAADLFHRRGGKKCARPFRSVPQPPGRGQDPHRLRKGFIRAQTIAFDDFITYKGEQGAKEAGKMRAEGKDYIVKDGDIMNFPCSTSNPMRPANAGLFYLARQAICWQMSQKNQIVGLLHDSDQ